MKPNVLVCDDVDSTAGDWEAELKQIDVVEAQFNVTRLLVADFKEAVQELEMRRRAPRDPDGKHSPKPWGEHIFDKAAMIIVDYDLLDLEHDSYLTGENVAYLARCFSRCGTIVALNQFGGENSFDLTLAGHVQSYADLNLGAKQLVNRALWTGDGHDFRPWSWPRLLDMPGELESRVRDVDGHLGDKVLEFLGISIESSLNLPRSVQSFLLGEEEDLDSVTLQRFVEDSGQGLRRKDKVFHPDSIGRIAAARLGTWLEQAVLPNQDLLIDAPHLVARCPSLIVGELNADNVSGTSTLGRDVALPLEVDKVAKWKYPKTNWLSRPAWFWNDLRESADLPEIQEPWEHGPLELVFREDSSDFGSLEESQQFIADLPSPNVRRYVRKPHAKDVDYRPKVRFAL